jgi:hypothetical protein
MNNEVEQETIEVPAERPHYERLGYVQYGMSMGRNNVVTLKMRRPTKKENQ